MASRARRHNLSESKPLARVLCLWLLIESCDPGSRLSSICDDQSCPAHFRCDRGSGVCVCASDAACSPDEFCAPDGTCRRRMACDTNLDCPEGMLCDSLTGQCVEAGTCTQDIGCPLGQICTSLFHCAPGCRANGDCLKGQVCRDDTCRPGLCEDKSFCPTGYLCDQSTETCIDAYDDTLRPYCRSCRPTGPGEPFSCGPGPNFCLMTGNDPSLPPFCGVDCSEGQECPQGYGCDLILRAVEGSCREDAECASGQCSKNEGDDVGFCLCSQDSECPRDACDDFTFQCRVTRRTCSPGGTECDRPIYCIDGLCLIGRNCAPVEGLRCADLGSFL